MSQSLDDLRVVDRNTAIEIVGCSRRTWDTLTARGETPPITRITNRRFGYRLIDLKAWLDARRVGPTLEQQSAA